MKQILLFKIWSIWDVLMTTPFIRQLKKWSPSQKIHYMVGNKSSLILEKNQYIDKIIPFRESTIFKKNLFLLISFLFKIMKMRNSYDAVVIFDKHRILGFLFKIAWFKKRIWFDRAGKDGAFLTDKILRDASKREIEYNISLLPLLNIEPDYEDQKYDFRFIDDNKSIDDVVKTLKTLGKKIVWISTWWWNEITNKIHKSKDCRRRSLSNRESLTKILIDQWYIVLLLWSWSDRHINITNQYFYDFLWMYSISESIYLISKIDMVICHESGFMHLVWCTQTPMIVLAGPTNPYRLSPYQHPWTIIWKESKECYNLYGEYVDCKWDEINKITIKDILDALK